MQTKKLISLLLAISLLCAVNVGAVSYQPERSEISPRYVGINLFDAKLSISTSGKATCTVSVRPSSPTYKIDLNFMLQNNDGDVIKSWSVSGERSINVEKVWYVKSGSQYQVVATATIYDADGNYVDSGTTYSRNVSY